MEAAPDVDRPRVASRVGRRVLAPGPALVVATAYPKAGVRPWPLRPRTQNQGSDPCRSGRWLKSPVPVLASEFPAERLEGGPAGIRRLVLVFVRLVVQVLAAEGAKA